MRSRDATSACLLQSWTSIGNSTFVLRKNLCWWWWRIPPLAIERGSINPQHRHRNWIEHDKRGWIWFDKFTLSIPFSKFSMHDTFISKQWIFLSREFWPKTCWSTLETPPKNLQTNVRIIPGDLVSLPPTLATLKINCRVGRWENWNSTLEDIVFNCSAFN